MTDRRTIEVGALARVEGEGALHLRIEGDRIADLRLEIYEPPRFFEAFLRGRDVAELPDLVARICGICPVAYQMSAVHALESIGAVEIHPGVRELRRLYYAGEWIESHLLHMVFLAAPDYLGLDDAFEVARLHRQEVERCLALRALGNRILEILGGRSVNPVGVCVGGFTRPPPTAELRALAAALRARLGEAEALLEWIASLPVPACPQEVELVSLRHPREYPMNEGRIVSSAGLDVSPGEFGAVVEERQVPHSTALHCRIRDRGSYLVGPLARILLNGDRLHPRARAARETLADRFRRPDPYASVFARGIEVIYAMEEAIRVADGLSERVPVPRVPELPAGVGHGATEAPRGLLYIRVETDGEQRIREIRIVPPTAQNQARIEEDLRAQAQALLDLPEDALRRRMETAIRNYDPCISCATHFLDLRVERGPTR